MRMSVIRALMGRYGGLSLGLVVTALLAVPSFVTFFTISAVKAPVVIVLSGALIVVSAIIAWAQSTPLRRHEGYLALGALCLALFVLVRSMFALGASVYSLGGFAVLPTSAFALVAYVLLAFVAYALLSKIFPRNLFFATVAVTGTALSLGVFLKPHSSN